jgi:hypothetical protein
MSSGGTEERSSTGTNDSSEQRVHRFMRATGQPSNDRNSLSRGDGVGHLPWWVIVLIAVIAIFLLMFVVQYGIQQHSLR